MRLVRLAERPHDLKLTVPPIPSGSSTAQSNSTNTVSFAPAYRLPIAHHLPFPWPPTSRASSLSATCAPTRSSESLPPSVKAPSWCHQFTMNSPSPNDLAGGPWAAGPQTACSPSRPWRLPRWGVLAQICVNAPALGAGSGGPPPSPSRLRRFGVGACACDVESPLDLPVEDLNRFVRLRQIGLKSH